MPNRELQLTLSARDRLTKPVTAVKRGLSSLQAQHKSLTDRLRNQQATQKQITALKKLQDRSGKLGGQLSTAQQRLQAHNQKMKSATKVTDAMVARQTQLAKKVKDAGNKIKEHSLRVRSAQAELKKRVVNIKHLTLVERKLARESKDTAKAIERSVARIARAQVRRQRLQALGRVPSRVLGGLKNTAKTAKIAGFGFVTPIIAGLYALNKIATEADTIGKLSAATKVSTGTIQAFRYAVRLSGGSAEESDKQIQTLSKRMGELKSDTGTLTTFLRKYDKGLLKNLKTTKTTEESIALLAEAIYREEDAQKKAALANAAFGRSHQSLLVLFEHGANGVKKYFNEFRRYGGGATEDFIKQSAEFKDTMLRLEVLFDSLKFRFAAPILERITKPAQEFLQNLKESDVEKLLDDWTVKGENFADALEKIAKAAIKIANGINSISQTFFYDEEYRGVKVGSVRTDGATPFDYSALPTKTTQSQKLEKAVEEGKRFLQQQKEETEMLKKAISQYIAKPPADKNNATPSEIVIKVLTDRGIEALIESVKASDQDITVGLHPETKLKALED